VIDFNGQAVVVTGAGRGLGRLYALELARRGASVVVNDIGGSMSGDGADPSVADQVVAEIHTAGGAAVASHDSVDSPEGGAAIVQCALDSFGRLDAVVSNAGIYGMSPFEDLTVEQWRRMLQVHLDGAFFLCQPAFRVMKEQGYGRFVLIASGLGAFGGETTAHYSAAKGGIIGFTNTLALEGAPHGIVANTVLPIGKTRMMDSGTEGRDLSPIEESLFAALQPERVVPMVVYLASRDCAVNRHNFSAGAGRYARAYMGLTEGWLADPSAPPATADDIAAHLEEITSADGAWVPASMGDEMFSLLPRLGIA
jgi:NAD(P)-dependent dehydrogenase (short-subunit alcohol dehydrogenase family)